MSDYGAELETKRWEWPLLLRDYYGEDLKPAEFRRWTTELKRELGDTLTDDDICNAIRHRSFSDKKLFGKPTLKDLRIWVCAWRGKDAPEPPIATGDYMTYFRSEMAIVIDRINKATTSCELWAAIYATGNLDWELKGREQAEEYARQHKPELYSYDNSKPVSEIVHGLARAWKGQRKQWEREPGEE